MEQQEVHPMRQRAEKLYPDSPYLQNEWLRAVAVVRGTMGGWTIERNHVLLNKSAYWRVH